MQTFTIPILDNGKPGPNRSLNLTLSSPSSNSSLGTPSTAALTIVNTNAPPLRVAIDFNGPDYVFLTPSDATNKLTAAATARVLTPVTANPTVTLSMLPGGGAFLFSTDNATWQSNVNLTLPSDGSAVPFTLSGGVASTKMRDAIIVATSVAQAVGKKAGTVPEVTLAFMYKPADNVKGVVNNTDDKGDDAAKNNYKKARKDGTYNLGPGEFKFPLATRTHGWGTMVVGTVKPDTFDKKISLQRNAQARWYIKKIGDQVNWMPGELLDFPAQLDAVPANDTSPAEFKDEEPQSGGSKGHVYDIDGPGVKTDVKDPKKGDIRSMRANFVAFATYLNPDTKKESRVSPLLKWYTKQSWVVTDAEKEEWAPDKSIAGDNETKEGDPILLSYALKSPVIESIFPNPLNLFLAKKLKDRILIRGDNFVEGCTVVLEKGKKKVDGVITEGGLDGAVYVMVPNLAKMEVGEWTVTLTNPADAKSPATHKLKILD